mgnify:CR=1 FL=1
MSERKGGCNLKIYEETPINIKDVLEPKSTVHYSFINGARVEILGSDTSDYKIGLDEQFNILAFEVEFYQNAGASADLSPAVLERTLNFKL